MNAVIPDGVCEVRDGFASHVFCAMNPSWIEEGFLTRLGTTRIGVQWPVFRPVLLPLAQATCLEQRRKLSPALSL